MGAVRGSIFAMAALALIALIALLGAAGCSRPPAAAAKSSAAPEPGPPRIAMFYANPQAPAENEKTLLCYSVENAASVRLEPPVESVWPSPNRCFGVPTRAATYTLVAERGSERVSQTVKVTPVPPKVMLFAVTISKTDVAPGEAISVCFNAINAVRATITPGSWIGPHGPGLGCVKDQPRQDTTYVIEAKGAGGDSATQRVTAHVVQKD